MKSIYKISILLILITILNGCDKDDNKLPILKPTASGVVTDERDGKEYKWVRYGDLEWLTDNFSYETSYGTCDIYRINEDIGQDYNANFDKVLEKYGRLYTYSGAKECEFDQWRVATDGDWNSLEIILGTKASQVNKLEWRGSFAGPLMIQKEEGSGLNFLYGGFWTANSSSFSKHFRLIEAFGLYWTATTDESKNGRCAFYRKITYNKKGVFRYSCDCNNMLSVRLVRDVIK